MSKYTRLIAIMLTMGVSCCACTSQSNDVNSDMTSEVTSSETDNTEDTTNSFPHEIKDFGGMTFTILADYEAGDQLDINDFDITESNGDVLNDAVFKRNQYIEETFNVSLAAKHAENGGFINEMRKYVASGDDDIQVGGVRYTNSYQLIKDGYCHELMQYDGYLTLDGAWWDSREIEEMTVKNGLYVIAGDFFYKHYDGIELLMFNKELAADYNIDNLYDLVSDGKWTLERMGALCKNTTIDLNGDGKITDVDDQFAFASQIDAVTTFVLASNVRLVEHEKDGSLSFTKETEKINNVIERVLNFYIDETWDAHRDNACKYGPANVFTSGHSLFCWGMARSLAFESYRSMEDEFGILPYPKYDEDQSDYLSYVNFWHGYGLIIPASVNNPEDIAYLMDAIAYYGAQMVTPEYYETCLTRKYIRDNESEAVLEIIFNNTVYDIGMYYNVGGIRDAIQKSFRNNQNVFASSLASIQERINSDIEKLNS